AVAVVRRRGRSAYGGRGGRVRPRRRLVPADEGGPGPGGAASQADGLGQRTRRRRGVTGLQGAIRRNTRRRPRAPGGAPGSVRRADSVSPLPCAYKRPG